MRIHEQNEVLKEQVKILMTGIKDLKGYLTSNKFDNDRNVNVTDVLTRLYEIQNAYHDTTRVVEV